MKRRTMRLFGAAISTLSFSELAAIIHIFNELDGEEGLLIASKIADRVGITRSVIVNALRKFESAGVIESRSLGMSGNIYQNFEIRRCAMSWRNIKEDFNKNKFVLLKIPR